MQENLLRCGVADVGVGADRFEAEGLEPIIDDGGRGFPSIATGTGLSAEAALAAVGPRGHVTAADLSPAMERPSTEYPVAGARA